MISRVEDHSRLNGFTFVIGEFALIGLVALALAVLYWARGNVILGSAFAGITANSLVVIFLAVHSLTKGETGVGVLRIYTQRALREQIVREHPDLSKDTVVITVSVLIPLLVLVLGLTETVRRRSPSARA